MITVFISFELIVLANSKIYLNISLSFIEYDNNTI